MSYVPDIDPSSRILADLFITLSCFVVLDDEESLKLYFGTNSLSDIRDLSSKPCLKNYFG